jgi:alkaline phosphatase
MVEEEAIDKMAHEKDGPFNAANSNKIDWTTNGHGGGTVPLTATGVFI